MSADNYYVIHKHPEGGYAAVMGFMSDDEEPKPTASHFHFATIADALAHANSDAYVEYGTRFSPEVRAELFGEAGA